MLIMLMQVGTEHTVEKFVKAWIVTSMRSCLEVNSDKTKYMIMSRDQNAGRSHNMESDSISLE